MNKKKLRISAKAVHYCLKNLGNPVALKRSSLIGLPQVSLLAKSYSSSSWSRAYALRDLLKTTCADILAVDVADTRQQRILVFLRLFVADPNVSAISRTMSIDRKNLYLYIMPKAFDLVAAELADHTDSAPTH
jgi:hypothetical protein